MMETDAVSPDVMTAAERSAMTTNATDVMTAADAAVKTVNAESLWPMRVWKTSEPPSTSVAPVTRTTSTIPRAKGAREMRQPRRRPTQTPITSTLE
ncbi:hypothetical protein PF004_g32996 [Phytophthora fragariae]|uniref:Uncharacterized protein n=1 Tax=Phytophthora fragariae TaxID=53985 RepID=A0A6G0M4Z4_9STRA|nr:hypothetical protein PF004_g32996 [Phytophthora fragariae]